VGRPLLDAANRAGAAEEIVKDIEQAAAVAR
jgi:hypothetical protein